MKKWLHRKYGWFECMFSQFDAYNDVIQCQWCGTKYKREGLPYIGGMKLTKLPK
jgi:hypothetical protein